LVVLAGAGSAAASSVGVGPRAAATVARCGPAAARALASSGVARVYASNGVVYGCSVHGSGSYRLGVSTPSIGELRVGRVAIAGEITAYALIRSGVDTVIADVVVTRLTDGTLLRSASAITRALGPELLESVGSVVVKGDGAVAWIAAAESIARPGGADVEVHKIEQKRDVLLARGAGIAPASLRLKRSRLTWRQGGRTFSAALR
jgi:hypothetical protein